MKKQIKNRWIAAALAILIVLTLTVIVVIAAEPGSESDPLITKSYIDTKVIPEIKNYIEQELSKLRELIGASNGGSATPTRFVLLNIANGQRFVAGSGCEFILRMGRGTIFSSAKGGIVDSTVGVDLTLGSVPANHLLISPLDDGRGFLADSEVIIMVKGNYEIK